MRSDGQIPSARLLIRKECQPARAPAVMLLTDATRRFHDSTPRWIAALELVVEGMIMRGGSRLVIRALMASAWLTLLPALAGAQSIAGVVRDASGGVLPGVTVEAASPALIEKVRTAVTDGSGQYRLESLVPGEYSVTYTLTGSTIVSAIASS